MLITISAFLVFLGVLITMMASNQAKKDKIGQRVPPEQARIAALILLVAGVGLFAYYLYTQAFG